MLIAGIGIANTLLSFINQNNMSIAVRKAVGFFSLKYKSHLLPSVIYSTFFDHRRSLFTKFFNNTYCRYLSISGLRIKY